MASRQTSKWRSEKQENEIAYVMDGVRSKSSGAADNDAGDVRTEDFLIECKQTGEVGKPAKSISVKLDDLEKIAGEAWEEGKDWAYAGRIYAPDSPLADVHGNVDFIAFAPKDIQWRIS